MRAIDTNVVVRILVRDDASQSDAADEFIDYQGAWLSHVALAEALWVLKSVYGLEPARIALSVGDLLNHKGLSIQEPDVVEAALASFRERPTLGFSDCLILAIARKHGHVPLGTFDRTLAKLEGAELL